MTEHKFTDEEIIKALEVCLEGDNCKECPINPNQGNYGYCTGLAMKEALNLINRQKTEVAYWMDAAANAKKEAVRAFSEMLKERLIDGGIYPVFVKNQMEKILKVMIGETL